MERMWVKWGERIKRLEDHKDRSVDEEGKGEVRE